MLQKKELLSQAGLANLNPRLTGLEDGGLVIPVENTSWLNQQNYPRRAILNNFGAAGSNAALLLEEIDQAQRSSQIKESRSAYVFNISAKSRDALGITISQYQHFLSLCTSHASLEDLCYTATARREIYNYRASISCESVEDLQLKLSRIDTTNVCQFRPRTTSVFVFSGQGSIHVAMGLELMRTSPPFRGIIHRCDSIIQELGFGSIIEFMSNARYGETILPESPEYVVIS